MLPDSLLSIAYFFPLSSLLNSTCARSFRSACSCFSSARCFSCTALSVGLVNLFFAARSAALVFAALAAFPPGDSDPLPVEPGCRPRPVKLSLWLVRSVDQCWLSGTYCGSSPAATASVDVLLTSRSSSESDCSLRADGMIPPGRIFLLALDPSCAGCDSGPVLPPLRRPWMLLPPVGRPFAVDPRLGTANVGGGGGGGESSGSSSLTSSVSSESRLRGRPVFVATLGRSRLALL